MPMRKKKNGKVRGPCRLAAAAAAHDLTLTEVARRSGLDRSNVTKIAQGKIQPSLYTACRLAMAIGCTLYELVPVEMREELHAAQPKL